MEEQDLREIGITDPAHRRKILSAARSLPKVCESMLCQGLSHAYNHFMPLTVLFCKMSIILTRSVVGQPVVFLYWV